MRLSALALDDDGTIAQGDAIGASVREAIAAVRDSGISVLLVTGRILSELCRVAGDLHFVDGVVAENGAVIHFPANDYSQVLAPPVAPAFTAELRRRGIAGQAGQCLVDFDTRDAPDALEVIRDLELPMDEPDRLHGAALWRATMTRTSSQIRQESDPHAGRPNGLDA
jgi:hydroxymethylpyrimidine pyrophosphatase-like HAD family hydrolase